MNSEISLYRQYLLEEERFLKNLERNLQDQINRLKVEELSVLKLISVTGGTNQIEDQKLQDESHSCDEAKKTEEKRLDESTCDDLNVNILPLNLNLQYKINSADSTTFERNKEDSVSSEHESVEL